MQIYCNFISKRFFGMILALLIFALCFLSGGQSHAKDIKIGVIDDHSGDFALPNIPKTHGAMLAVEEINANGGVLGRKIKLIHYDGQSDVKRYQELARKLILDDEVDVIMAGYTSSEREAARSVAVKNKTIFWHNNQGEGGIADKYSFFTGPIPEQQILTGVEYMINKYGPKMYTLAADYGFGQVSALWTHVAAGLFKGEIVGEEFIPLGNSEFASTIANVQKAKPDFMVHYLVGANQSQFYPQAQAAGLNLPAISTVNLQQGYEHKRFPAPALANMYIPVAYIEEIPTDANKEFIRNWHKKHPDEPYINQPARCAYVAVHIMAKAWEVAGTTETKEVISALESGITFDAPEGRVLLDPATHHLTMVIRMAHIDKQHNVSWVHNFGAVEPWWLRTLGVNLVARNDAKQYLPWDDPRYAKYKKK
jgi:branched-chain amino acid transport system substrate-binding protein